MKKLLLYVLISTNFLLLSSEHDREYTKNTCNRTFNGRHLSTDEEREYWLECGLSRWEVYDKDAQKYIGNIAYDPRTCSIEYLSVDQEYRKKGIGADLARRAIADMRAMDNCREISLISASEAEKFWEKLGAKPKPNSSRHVFPDPSIFRFEATYQRPIGLTINVQY